MRRDVTPARWPAADGWPLAVAQRELPSMMTARWLGRMKWCVGDRDGGCGCWNGEEGLVETSL